MRVEIDDPLTRTIEKAAGELRGWIATSDLELPEVTDFRIGAIVLWHEMVKREDVEEAMPDHTILGFVIRYELATLLPNIQDNRLLIVMTLPGFDPYPLPVKIGEMALALCLETAGGV